MFLKKRTHKFHLVTQSSYPIILSLSTMIFAIGFLSFINNVIHGKIILIFGFISLIVVLFLWWKDVIKEGQQGFHSKEVDSNFRLGFVLFIISEIMFFFSFFWAFFYVSISPSIHIGCIWPPKDILPLNSFGIPFVNTLILLTSGLSITWAHLALKNRDLKYLKKYIPILDFIYKDFKDENRFYLYLNFKNFFKKEIYFIEDLEVPIFASERKAIFIEELKIYIVGSLILLYLSFLLNTFEGRLLFLLPFKITMIWYAYIFISGYIVNVYYKYTDLYKSQWPLYWTRDITKENDRVNREISLAFMITFLLAFLFIFFQISEYLSLPFSIFNGIFASVFFMLTGFHGFHVIIGTIFLIICYIRFQFKHFTSRNHLAFEMAIWYWHFVDVVWIFLYLFLYVWGNI